MAASGELVGCIMHTCPDCGQACTCNGDIEDHENEFAEEDCEHKCEQPDEEQWGDL